MFSHSTKHAKSIRWREDDILPYRELYVFWGCNQIFATPIVGGAKKHDPGGGVMLGGGYQAVFLVYREISLTTKAATIRPMKVKNLGSNIFSSMPYITSTTYQ